MNKGGAIMKPTVYGIEKTGFDPESDVDIVLWKFMN